MMLAALPFVAAIAVAFGAWLVAGFSLFGILRHARNGRWFRLMFSPGWWNPAKVDHYLEPDGLPHYRRC